MNRKNAAGCVTKETRSGICSSKSLAEEKKEKKESDVRLIMRNRKNAKSKDHKGKNDSGDDDDQLGEMPRRCASSRPRNRRILETNRPLALGVIESLTLNKLASKFSS